MQTTKGQILWLLKRNGGETVDHLTEALALAPMTIRQHLAALARDGLISMREERQRKGRPHFVYSLTEKGEETFPKRYDRLAAQVLNEIGRIEAAEITDLAPAERTALVFRRIADRIVAEHAQRLFALSLPERVQEVAAILERENGFVECIDTPDGFEIRDYNCVYRRLAGPAAAGCAWHLRVIGRLVGAPVERSAAPNRDATFCRYLIAREPWERRTDPGGEEELARNQLVHNR